MVRVPAADARNTINLGMNLSAGAKNELKFENELRFSENRSQNLRKFEIDNFKIDWLIEF